MTRDRETERIVSLFSEHPGRVPAPEPDPDPEDSLWFWDPAIHIYPPDSLLPSCSGSDANQVQEQEKRIPLEVYLRPLAGLTLPGQAELERYVAHKYRRNMKRNTLAETVANGKLFLRFLQQQGTSGVKEIRREDLEAYVEQEQDRGMKPRTVKCRLASAYAFLGFLIEHGEVDREVKERKIRLKLPESLPRAIDPEDVRKLLSVIRDVRNRALILVLLRTGMRIGELLGTKEMDVHLKERRIEIPQAEKSGVGRVVYLSEDAQAALHAWMNVRDSQRVFLFYAQGKRREKMTYGAARMVFVKYVRKAGLANKGYSLHRLRHTFASEMLNAGMRLECLQQLLGHTNIQVTRQYARLTDKTREEEYFRAMEVIEKDGIHGHYQLDPELQAFLEEEKLLD
jgi:integrase/recombinase XerC/integrase/recombinase XerD